MEKTEFSIKINSDSGNIIDTYNAGSSINRLLLLVGNFIYIKSVSGGLHKVNTNQMTETWVYSFGSRIVTPPAYSVSRDVVVFCSENLYVHAVNNINGSQKWRVKPTLLSVGYPITFDGQWPVIADQHGVVFVRLNLGMDGLWSGIGPGNMYPDTNAATRSYLLANPDLKNLFALNLDSGSESFVPAVGYGGVETIYNSEKELEIGTLPVVQQFSDRSEVAYQIFRSGQGSPPDGRWDSHLGEIALDQTTIPGLVAGDLRFVQFDNSYTFITDEQSPMTMAGDTIFFAHWGASESMHITDRSSQLGLIHDNPIKSENRLAVIRRQQSCTDFDPTDHYTTCGLTLYSDGRYWLGPGFWSYWNVIDPPVVDYGAYSDGLLPRYTYVSDGLIVVEGNGGDLMVFKHNGGTP